MRLSILLAVALLAGCATHAGGIVPPTNGEAVFAPDLVPPSCKGQKTTKQYASLTEKLLAKGGSLCIPAFGGFGGTITYPPANPAAKIALTSSTTNYDGMPQLGNGTPIFYLQLALLSRTTFGNDVQAGGGLESKTIKPLKAYTAYAAVKAFGGWVPLAACYTIAKKSKYGGQIAGLGTLLQGQKVPPTSGVVEIYPGKQTGSKCG